MLPKVKAAHPSNLRRKLSDLQRTQWGTPHPVRYAAPMRYAAPNEVRRTQWGTPHPVRYAAPSEVRRNENIISIWIVSSDAAQGYFSLSLSFKI